MADFFSQIPSVQLYKGAGKMLGLGGGDTDQYQHYLNQAMQALQQHEAIGRGDLTGYYGKAMGFGEPYRAAGASALGQYEGTLGMGGPQARQQALESFRTSPGYQFALQQGLQGVQRGMAAHGLSGSGAEQKGLERYGQGLASQEFGQYQQRLAGLAGMGQQQSAQDAQMAYGTGGRLASLGQGYGGDIASLYGTMGAAQAQQRLAQQQQQGQLLGTLGKLGSTALEMAPFL